MVVLDQAGGAAAAAPQTVRLATGSATARAVSVSGGRVAWIDDAKPAGAVHSQQVVAEDGTLRLAAAPADLRALGSGPTALYAHGTRTVVIGSDRRGELVSGTGSVAPAAAWTLPADAREVSTDGTWLTYRDAFGRHLVNMPAGRVSPAGGLYEVDGGFLWSVTSVAGGVRKRPLQAGEWTTVLPADPTCPITGLDARQGDLLVRCASGQARVYAAGGGTPLLTVPDESSTRLGSGLLWRVVDGMLTATAYRSAGAPVTEVFPVGADGTYAVDREAPWAARVDAAGGVTVSLVPGQTVPRPASRFYPMTATRMVDTRPTGPVTAGRDQNWQLAGIGAVPASATGVVVSVTVTRPTAASWLAVYPSGRYGGSSTVNFAAGQTVTVQTFAPLRDGKVGLRVGAGSADVLLDVVGYHQGVSVLGGEHVAVPPERLLDTRGGAPVSAGAPRTVPVRGRAGLPTDVSSVVVNVTVTGASGSSYLSLGGAAGKFPTTVSYLAGRGTAAMAVVPLAPGGGLVATLGGGTAHLVLDVIGYVPSFDSVADERQADYFASGPVRLLDTRSGSPVAAGADRRVQVAGVAGVPRGATAVLLTVVATRSSTASWLSVYTAAPWPGTSTLNYPAGLNTANTALVRLAPDGSVALRVGAGSSHVVLDVAGYLQR